MRDKNKDAYWFSHDSNAKDDPKCMLLIDQLGLEGYGIYWVLIEILRDQPDFSYPLALIPAIAKRYGTTVPKVETVVTGFGLFEIRDDRFFYSPSLVSRLLTWKEKQDRRTAAALKANLTRWGEKKQLPESGRNPVGIQTESEGNPNLSHRIEENRIEENNNSSSSPKGSELSPCPTDTESGSSEEERMFPEEKEGKPVEGVLSKKQCQQVVDYWNRTVVASQSSLSIVKVLTDDRVSKIRVRWKEFSEMGNPVEVCKVVFEKTNGSKFLQGDNVKGWKASFDWLFTNGKNWTKVYEGNYEDKVPVKQTSTKDVNASWNR